MTLDNAILKKKLADKYGFHVSNDRLSEQPFWQIRKGLPGVVEFIINGRINAPVINSSFFSVAGRVVEQISSDLRAMAPAERIDIYMNCAGGEVSIATAIYNILKRHPAQKHVYIAGICGSAATIITLAADFIFMHENAKYFIHEGQSIVIGSASDIFSAGAVLKQQEEESIRMYAKRTGLSKNRLQKMCAAETLLTAAEALKFNFVDKVLPPVPISANSLSPSQQITESQCMVCAFHAYKLSDTTNEEGDNNGRS